MAKSSNQNITAFSALGIDFGMNVCRLVDFDANGKIIAARSLQGYFDFLYWRSFEDTQLRSFLCTGLVVAATLAPALTGSMRDVRAENWMLMGREGGCVTLVEAALRMPFLDGVTAPDQLAAKLRRQGEEVSRQDIGEGDVIAVQIDAPGLDLGLKFVPPSLCL